MLCPLLANDRNHESWPHVVSQDVLRHVHNLKSSVYVVSGQVKGKTLLPLPVGTEKVNENVAEVEERFEKQHYYFLYKLDIFHLYVYVC